MALLVHAYQVEGNDVHSLMVALRQLNTTEEAEEDVHEVCIQVSKYWICQYTYVPLSAVGGSVCYNHWMLSGFPSFTSGQLLCRESSVEVSTYNIGIRSRLILIFWLQIPRHSVWSWGPANLRPPTQCGTQYKALPWEDKWCTRTWYTLTRQKDIAYILHCCTQILGVAARRIASQMHGVSMEMITLPLLLNVQLSCLRYVHVLWILPIPSWCKNDTLS